MAKPRMHVPSYLEAAGNEEVWQKYVKALEEREMALFGSYGVDRAAALEDLMWALLNSKDFLLVH